MSGGQAERIYGMRELTRILTLTPRRIGQLRRLDLLRGDSGYTYTGSGSGSSDSYTYYF